MDREEMGRKAKEAFVATKAAARKLGGIAADIGREGFSAARDKVGELRENARRRREAEAARQQDADATSATRSVDGEADATSAARSVNAPYQREDADATRAAALSKPPYQGAPDDIHFIIRGWLVFVWWIGNIVDTVGCLVWFAKSMDHYYTRDTAWIPLVALPVLLFFNRLAYELAIAVFEGIKHLRQIRDELRRLNARAEDEEGRMVIENEHDHLKETAERANQ